MVCPRLSESAGRLRKNAVNRDILALYEAFRLLTPDQKRLVLEGIGAGVIAGVSAESVTAIRKRESFGQPPLADGRSFPRGREETERPPR